MAKNNNQKVVVITGARSGIGLAAAKYFLRKGVKVYGVALHEDNLGFPLYKADICNSSEMENVLKDVFQKEGRIDAVINNAGIGISGAIENTAKERVEKIFNTNVIAAIDICKLAIPYLRQTEGKIINTSSVAAPASVSFQACYSATKSALESFSLALSKEIRNQKIKVCCVRPGDTKTGFTDARLKNESDNSYYKDIVRQKTDKMEKSERNGVDPIKVAKVMYKCFIRKNPPLICSVGFGYKAICLLLKILPTRLTNYLVYKLY